MLKFLGGPLKCIFITRKWTKGIESSFAGPARH